VDVMGYEDREDWVLAVAVTPDGTQMISAQAYSATRVWNLASGQRTTPFAELRRQINPPLLVMPDGMRVVGASEDRKVCMWDLTSREIRNLSQHTNSIRAIAVNLDGTQVISASRGELRVWDLPSDREVHSSADSDGAIRAKAVTPDSARVVGTHEDGSVGMWDLVSGRCLLTTALPGPVRALKIVSGTGSEPLLVTGDDSGAVAAFTILL
jgi:WD40 repeat protein